MREDPSMEGVAVRGDAVHREHHHAVEAIERLEHRVAHRVERVLGAVLHRGHAAAASSRRDGTSPLRRVTHADHGRRNPLSPRGFA
jgi:hypothetical protein